MIFYLLNYILINNYNYTHYIYNTCNKFRLNLYKCDRHFIMFLILAYVYHESFLLQEINVAS